MGSAQAIMVHETRHYGSCELIQSSRIEKSVDKERETRERRERERGGYLSLV